MKKVIILLVILICIAIFGFYWITKLSPRARKSKANVENSLELKLGMQRKDMIEIMGAPDDILYYNEGLSGDSIYFYNPPFASSDGIEIIIKGDTINKINHFE